MAKKAKMQKIVSSKTKKYKETANEQIVKKNNNNMLTMVSLFGILFMFVL